jgi:hypothetical protein
MIIWLLIGGVPAFHPAAGDCGEAGDGSTRTGQRYSKQQLLLTQSVL